MAVERQHEHDPRPAASRLGQDDPAEVAALEAELDGMDLMEQTFGPSGWRRVLIGLAVGLVAGALIALVLPRDEVGRERTPASADPVSDPDAAERRS